MAVGLGILPGGGLNMAVDGNAQAILLLTVSFDRAAKEGVRPLTGREWHRLAAALQARDIEPRTLLHENLQTLLLDWTDKTVSATRLSSLLERGLALSVALEKWERTGLWVIATTDQDYPSRLRERLKDHCPPALFGCGPREVLSDGGIAVVGSRDADDENLEFTRQFGATAAVEGCVVVSGGSRGVDQSAMFGALERGGNVVGVLADGLFAAASSATYRDFLYSGNLTLITPFNPEARFDVGNAMGRNKLIYCLADGAVVVSSALGRGWHVAGSD